MTCRAKIRGIPDIPSVVEVNVRAGAGTNQQLLFKMPVGLSDLPVVEVQPDLAGSAFNGKVYQWFRLTFPNGQTGWVRDDLLEIVGECGSVGYSTLSNLTFAFTLTRNTTAQASSTTPSSTPSTTVPPSQTSTPPVDNQQMIDNETRIRKAAFAVTAAFEGHGYADYQNYDRGIISYGRFQFALNGGLGAVVERYLSRSNTQVAIQLRPYLPRIKAVDESLRNDPRLRELLISAASEKVMQDVQDEVATENYWNRVMEVSVRPRGLHTPLGLAMLFDTGIQYGIMHSLIGLAEDDLKVPRKSRVGENGITEQQLIAQVAERRKRGLYAQAAEQNLPGLKPRADFWVNLIQKNDWGFQGDLNGIVNVNGKIVQISNP